MKNFLKEPLLHFLLIGGLFFVIDKILHPEPEEDVNTIELQEKQLEPAIERFRRNYDRQPADQDLKEMLDLYVLEEIYYREAIAMKMNENDPAVKRLLAQRYEEFLREQVNASNPGDDSLKAFILKRSPGMPADSLTPEVVQSTVITQWRNEHRSALKAAMVDKLKAKYKVQTDSEKYKKLLEQE